MAFDSQLHIKQRSFLDSILEKSPNAERHTVMFLFIDFKTFTSQGQHRHVPLVTLILEKNNKKVTISQYSTILFNENSVHVIPDNQHNSVHIF